MDKKQITQKSLNEDTSVTPEDLELINKNALKPLSADDVYTFKVQICDNDIDRVGDKMTDHFLEQVADNIKGVTGLKDHEWNVENQLARLYDAEVVEDTENKTELNEPRKYVLGKAYTLKKNQDLIDNINAGLLKEVSISFNSKGDTCSICGAPMVKDSDDIGHCSNGHVAQQFYNNKKCFNVIDELEDVLEWSLVAVPCQRRAGINNKNIGGTNIMKRTELLIRQFMSSKSFEKAAPEDKEALDAAVKSDENTELTDEDIKKILDENGKLKEKVKELETKVKEANDGRERDKIESIVSKGLDDLNPLTDKVKEMMLKDIPWDTLKLEDGQIPGMEDILNNLKESYKGLFKGCGDGDVETKETPETPETPEVENKEAPETKEEPETKANETVGVKEDPETPEVKSKAFKGITFGVNSKSMNKHNPDSNKKPGIYFN